MPIIIVIKIMSDTESEESPAKSPASKLNPKDNDKAAKKSV
jgi:hypothetical protein